MLSDKRVTERPVQVPVRAEGVEGRPADGTLRASSSLLKDSEKKDSEKRFRKKKLVTSPSERKQKKKERKDTNLLLQNPLEDAVYTKLSSATG